MGISTKNFRGLPVHDAAAPRIVTITKRDIQGGYTRLPNYCVVQHALKRETRKADKDIYVSPYSVLIREEDRWVRYKPSNALKIEIIVHDRGGEAFTDPEHNTYLLNPPAKSMRLGQHREAKQRRQAHEKLRRPLPHKVNVRERITWGEQEE